MNRVTALVSITKLSGCHRAKNEALCAKTISRSAGRIRLIIRPHYTVRPTFFIRLISESNFKTNRLLSSKSSGPEGLKSECSLSTPCSQTLKLIKFLPFKLMIERLLRNRCYLGRPCRFGMLTCQDCSLFYRRQSDGYRKQTVPMLVFKNLWSRLFRLDRWIGCLL